MATTSNTTLSRYIGIVNAFPKLTRERELELWNLWHVKAESKAKDELVRANLRYVVAIAQKYRSHALPMLDLIAEGNFGLVHAISRFEPERGNRFVTYAAYWIRAFILDYIIRSWSMVGAGAGALRSKFFFKLRRERIRIQNLVGEGDQADTMLAERLHISREQLALYTQRVESHDVSLDRNVFADGTTALVDVLACSNLNLEQAYVAEEQKYCVGNLVRAALETLDPREKFIVEAFWMRDSEETLSLAELGRRLGVSRERARQLETRAMKKLRRRITELASREGLSGMSVDFAA